MAYFIIEDGPNFYDVELFRPLKLFTRFNRKAADICQLIQTAPKKDRAKLLTERLWWWRYIKDPENPVFNSNVPCPEDLTRLISSRCLNAAWFYEFRARYNYGYRWDFEYLFPCIHNVELSKLTQLIPEDYTSNYVQHHDLNDPLRKEHFWTPSDFVVNLYASDKEIINDFKTLLNKARREREIIQPKVRARTRSLPWGILEQMDLKKFTEPPLDDGMRSKRSKENAHYKASCERINLTY